MLFLKIKDDLFKLHSDTKRQMELKHELLSHYKGSEKVVITDKGEEIETLLLEDLFCEPIERVRNAGLLLPGK